MDRRQFYIRDDGIRLNARLDVPEGSRRLVIVIHGFTGHRRRITSSPSPRP